MHGQQSYAYNPIENLLQKDGCAYSYDDNGNAEGTTTTYGPIVEMNGGEDSPVTPVGLPLLSQPVCESLQVIIEGVTIAIPENMGNTPTTQASTQGMG